MAGRTAPGIVRNGLIAFLDASNPKSYSSTGTIWTDLSGNGSNATLVNGPSFITSSNNYINFDATNDYADISLANNINGVITIEGWIRWNTFTSGMFFGFQTYDVWTNGNTLGYNNGAGNVIGISAQTVSNLNLLGTWNHYTFVMNGSSTYYLSENKIYINAVSQSLSAVVGNDGDCLGFSGPLRLNGWGNDTNYKIDISYANLRVYNRELTNKEILQNYNTRSEKFGSKFKILAFPDAIPQLPTYTTASSAYAIKQANPSATSGYYYIRNTQINNGNDFLIYADMETDGGGWTLILFNNDPNDWTYANAIDYNTSSPNPGRTGNSYSIIKYADALKKSSTGFQYMIEGRYRNSNGGIYTANSPYSFTSSLNTNTNITLNTKFGSWSTGNGGGQDIRMPYYTNTAQGTYTTTEFVSSNWYGTLITQEASWTPAPYIQNISSPSRIWMWVR